MLMDSEFAKCAMVETHVLQTYNPAPTFLPIDLAMYNLSKRPPGKIKDNSGHISPEAALKINGSVESSIGSDQSGLKHNTSNGVTGSLAMQEDVLSEAPWITISDAYAEFVRSGQITVYNGRVVQLDAAKSSQGGSVVVSSGDGEQVIDDIAAIILATGFEATDSLNFLPDDVLKTLNFDPKCPALPLVLHLNSTVHHDIPDLGFVGFYRGPFWGVMEMQARLLGKLWTGDEKATSALKSRISNIPDLRKCFYDNPKQLAQFPMGDYTYLMESFKEILNLESTGEARRGPVLPARYTFPDPDGSPPKESLTALSIVNNVLSDSAHHGKFVARAIFRSLQGDWNLKRSLISSISTYPSGTFHGTAKFFPRFPDAEYDAEYLYLEEGDFETEQGLKFRANRR